MQMIDFFRVFRLPAVASLERNVYIRGRNVGKSHIFLYVRFGIASFLEHISNIVEQCQAHVVDLKVGAGRKRSTLEIYVDHEQGVDADTLARISGAVSEFLETQDLFDTAYDLVVSSPGLERPLRYDWQYRRHLGAQCELKLHEEQRETTQSGILISADADGVTLRQLKNEVCYGWDLIVEGRIIPSLKKRNTNAIDTAGERP